MRCTRQYDSITGLFRYYVRHPDLGEVGNSRDNLELRDVHEEEAILARMQVYQGQPHGEKDAAAGTDWQGSSGW
eukprot:2526659-Lingulodinium_polyedra.AAC.1